MPNELIRGAGLFLLEAETRTVMTGNEHTNRSGGVRDYALAERMANEVAKRLTGIIELLMATQSVLGLTFRDQYRDVEWIRATWWGNDWVTLIIAVPLMVGGAWLSSRGSVRGLVLWLGTLGYAAYNYAYYLFGAALNAFFPLYVLLVVLSVAALILALSRVDVEELAASFRSTTPVRMIGGYYAFIGVGLGSAWLAMWAAYVFRGQPTPVEPEAFKLVAALDLSVMATVLLVGGVLLWRRHPWGYVIATMAGMQGSLYLLVLSVNSAVAIHRGLASAPGELPVWGALAAVTTIVTIVLLFNVERHASWGSNARTS